MTIVTDATAGWADRSRGQPLLDAAIFVCFFLSGASCLIYEVVWLRWLVQLLGATALAVSTILATFMAGLALGSWVGGRLAARRRRPLVTYGILELAIGAYALVLPVLLQGVPAALPYLGVTGDSSFENLSLVRFALSGTLLLVPTACMGATLPVLAQLAAPDPEVRGGRIGRLYAINTAGAVLGTATAGFVLLPVLGVTRTNAIAAALNGAVGLAAILAGRGRVVHSGVPAPRPGTPRSGTRRLYGAALATVALSGALALAYEVAWTRALSLVLGSTVYAFTIMLTTFLIGLASGSYLLARRVDRLAEPGRALVWVQLGIGIAAFGGLFVLDELPYLFVRLFAMSAGHHALLLSLEFLVAGALILVPALLSGAVFPLALRLTAGAEGGTGQAVGVLNALNTGGAIVGSFLAGFVLVPAVGIQGTLVVAILLNIGLTFALLVALPVRRSGVTTALAAALPLVAVAIPLVTPEWRPLLMASGVTISAPRLQSLSRLEFRQALERPRLLFYEEGLTTTVSVEMQARRIALRVNGKMDASTGVDMPNQVLLGHLPILFHASPQDVLVIGFGSGVTVGSALDYPVRAVTVLELERAVIRASRWFGPVNGKPLEDPRTRVVVNDARGFLALTEERFDIIISEPSNPWITGAASLFTTNFFRNAKDRLRPGGIFGQWVQLYQLTPEMFRSIVATFHSVFPYVVVFRTSIGDTVLVGGERPLHLDHETLERRLGQSRVADDLRRIGISDAADLVALLVLDVDDIPRYAGGAPLNTDDNAYLEFEAPRHLYFDGTLENGQQLTRAFLGVGGILGELRQSAETPFLARLAERFRERGQPAHASAVAPEG